MNILFTGRQYKIIKVDGVLHTVDNDGDVVAINSATESGFECAVNNINYNECRFDDLKSKYYKEE